MPSRRSAPRAAVLFTTFSAITLSFAFQLNGQQRQVLPTRSSAPAGLVPVGRLPESQRLNLAITLKLRNREELQNLLHELYDPASPDYRHFLTVEQFTERFGPTSDDYQKVKTFASSNSLEITPYGSQSPGPGCKRKGIRCRAGVPRDHAGLSAPDGTTHVLCSRCGAFSGRRPCYTGRLRA